jgi:hypothetical protein
MSTQQKCTRDGRHNANKHLRYEKYYNLQFIYYPSFAHLFYKFIMEFCKTYIWSHIFSDGFVHLLYRDGQKIETKHFS